MSASNYTISCRRKLWILRLIDLMILIIPLGIYLTKALLSDGATANKVGLVGMCSIALILVIFNVIAQKRLRCPIWIVLIGIYLVIGEYLLPLIIMLAVSTVLDDLVLTPLIHKTQTQLITNKEMDKRGI